MERERLIAMVDGLLGDEFLCGGCKYGEKKGYDEYGSCAVCRRVGADEIIRILRGEEHEPFADRPTGKWKRPQGDSGDAIVIAGWCSVCGWHFYLYEDDVVGMNFCPNCGAKMEGGEEE